VSLSCTTVVGIPPMCTTVVGIPPMCTMVGCVPEDHGGVCTEDHAGYVPEDHAGYVHPRTMVGIHLRTMVGIHPSPPICLLYHPGYTTILPLHLSVCASAPAHAEVPDRGALGSRRRYPVGERRREPSSLPKCEERREASAHCYSAFPVRIM